MVFLLAAVAASIAVYAWVNVFTFNHMDGQTLLLVFCCITSL